MQHLNEVYKECGEIDTYLPASNNNGDLHCIRMVHGSTGKLDR